MKIVERNLCFGHLGNGLVVFDTLHEKNGDYEKVAHIGNDRKVRYYADLGTRDILDIEDHATFSDPCVSTTQNSLVFLDRPMVRFDRDLYKICRETYNSGIVFTGMTIDGEEITDGFETYALAAEALVSEVSK